VQDITEKGTFSDYRTIRPSDNRTFGL